jgi:hypothetical protein
MTLFKKKKKEKKRKENPYSEGRDQEDHSQPRQMVHETLSQKKKKKKKKATKKRAGGMAPGVDPEFKPQY